MLAGCWLCSDVRWHSICCAFAAQTLVSVAHAYVASPVPASARDSLTDRPPVPSNCFCAFGYVSPDGLCASGGWGEALASDLFVLRHHYGIERRTGGTDGIDASASSHRAPCCSVCGHDRGAGPGSLEEKNNRVHYGVWRLQASEQRASDVEQPALGIGGRGICDFEAHQHGRVFAVVHSG